MLAENFDPMFPIELIEKDFKYAINLALSNGASSPLADAALCVFGRAVSQGLGSRNITGIVQSYRS
jgi:3-hydroxyisobutyrate dehydrogenase-like beta-hydroxyacid dehydrogenase